MGDQDIADTIIAQAPGWTIAITDEAGTLVPYKSMEAREDGTQNFGWVDLRGRPELVSQIPELQKSKGLTELVRAMAVTESQVMSGACECGEFSQETDPPIYVGGFVSTMFRDTARNRSTDNFVDMAQYLLKGIKPADQHHIGFEFIIEPLKSFFGETDCYGMMIKPIGRGNTSEEAWAAFNYAAGAVARSLTRDRSK